MLFLLIVIISSFIILGAISYWLDQRQELPGPAMILSFIAPISLGVGIAAVDPQQPINLLAFGMLIALSLFALFVGITWQGIKPFLWAAIALGPLIIIGGGVYF